MSTKTIKVKDIEIELTREELENALADFDKADEYPRCFRSISNNDPFIVLFDSIDSGTVVKSSLNSVNKGGFVDSYIPHDATSRWKEIPYNRERGFYDGQIVYAWDGGKFANGSDIGRYNCERDGIYQDNDTSDTLSYDNYSAELPAHIKELM